MKKIAITLVLFCSAVLSREFFDLEIINFGNGEILPDIKKSPTEPYGNYFSCRNSILHRDGISLGVRGKAFCTNDGHEIWLSCTGDTMYGARRENQVHCR